MPGKSISFGRKPAHCFIAAYVMFAFDSATGTSNPASLIPRNTVPVGVPTVQAISACGFALLILAICAATERSVLFMYSCATILTFLFSGRLSTCATLRSASCPTASLGTSIAKRVNPRSRKNRTNERNKSGVPIVDENEYEFFGGRIPGEPQYCTILFWMNGMTAKHVGVMVGPMTTAAFFARIWFIN